MLQTTWSSAGMNNNTHLREKVVKQAKQIDKLDRDVAELRALVDKLMSDDFQAYLDKAISDSIANYEIKELMDNE